MFLQVRDASSRRFYYFSTGLLFLALIAKWILIVVFDVCFIINCIYYELFTTNCLLRTIYYELFTTNCLLRTVYYDLFTTILIVVFDVCFISHVYLLRNIYYERFTTNYLLQTIYYELFTSNYFLRFLLSSLMYVLLVTFIGVLLINLNISFLDIMPHINIKVYNHIFYVMLFSFSEYWLFFCFSRGYFLGYGHDVGICLV